MFQEPEFFIKSTKTIANDEKDKLKEVQEHKSTKAKVIILQKQKKRLFEKARDRIKSIDFNYNHEDIKK